PAMWVHDAYTPAPAPPASPSYDIWRYYDITLKLTPPGMGALTWNGPGAVSSAFPDSRFKSDAVANTQLAMGMLQAIPNNHRMIANLSAQHFLEAPPATLSMGTPPKLGPSAIPPVQPNPPIMLDAWYNPIIF